MKGKRIKIMKGKFALFSLLFFVVVAVYTCDTGASSDTTTSGRLLTASEFGDDWPLTVSSGYVDCEEGMYVVFRANGITYAVNGTALSFKDRRGYVDIHRIWKDHPTDPDMKVYLGPVLSAGLELCD